MTSAWNEPPGGDDRAEGQDVGLNENQLEMFEAAPRSSTEMLMPPEADVVHGSDRCEGGGQQHLEAMVTEVPTGDFLDVGRNDSDELRRLEDSIRWLMNEGSVRHMPRAATLPPVRGLSPVEPHDDDALLLNPDTLFAPRPVRRRGGVVRGAAKILLVSAIAAPTAYFIANWMQFPGGASPSDSASIGGSFEERIAAVASRRQSPDAVRIADEISGASEPVSMVMRGMLPVETSPEVATEASAATPKDAPGHSTGVSATPADPAPASSSPTPAPAVASLAPAAASPAPAVASLAPAAASPAPAVASPAPVAASPAPAISSPAPVAASPAPAAAPPKPVLSAEEIAVLVERGRVLFEAGDLAAARLFFRRAASAGDAAAALAMGATYDPEVLAKRFIRGIEANPREARMWYEKARELGSPEGPRRIEMLAQQQGN